jgi:uncharacterized protein YybS (DUF2232 family)
LNENKNTDEKTPNNDMEQTSPQAERQTAENRSAGRQLPPLTPARRMAEGALMVALSTIFGMLTFYAPLLDILLLIVYPIPIAFLIKRHNISTGLLAFAASSLLLTLFLGITNAAFVILSMGAVGIWYGIAWRKNIRPMRTVVIGTVLAAVSVAVTMLLSLWTMGVAAGNITAYISQYVDETVAALQSAGLFEMMAGGVSAAEYSKTMTDMLANLIPGMMIIAAMLEALLCYIISGAVFRRLGIDIKTLPKFRDWHLAWPALWGLIIALLAYLGYHYLGYDWLKTIALNVIYIYYPILMVTGISLVIWFCKTTKSLFMPIVLIVGAVIFPGGIVLAVLMFGLFDAIVDFRSWFRKNAKNRPPNGI